MQLQQSGKRWLALIIFICIASVIFYIAHPYLSFHALQQHYHQLQHWKDKHLILSMVTMMLIYTSTVCFSIPGTAILTILSGFLFGISIGLCIAVLSATTGATCLFLFAKWFGASWIKTKNNHWIHTIQTEVQSSALNYLLILRLIPLFPFPAVNIACGLLNISTRIFIVTTLVGIIPGSFVYIALGKGLRATLLQHKHLSLDLLFSPSILLPLLALACLAAIPIFYKHIKKDA